MAHNKFGCICDICGNMSDNVKAFYHLRLPTYETEINNSDKSLDYCIDCYEDLKNTLAKHYNCNWAFEKEKING